MTAIDTPFKRKLTPYHPGSLRELWHITMPLMLTLLSVSIMNFLDRIILAHYSTQAMNVAVTLTTVFWVVEATFAAIASIAEVFVGQYNGSGQYHRLGAPVWQMIWFSLASAIIFLPLALFAGPLFVPHAYLKLGLPYYQWLMYFGPMGPISTALAAFFIGQGKVRLVTVLTIFANVVNFVLDLILIFGIHGVIPRMGPKGAAIATGIATTLQAGILFLFFISRSNRIRFGTARFVIELKLLYQCLRIGAPTAIGFMIEVIGWATMMQVMARLNTSYITVYGIGQSIFLLISFISEGMSKGVTAITSNFIGAKYWRIIPKTIFSGLKLQLLFAIALSVPLLLFPDMIIQLFLPKKFSTTATTEIYRMTELSLRWFWIFFLFDGCTWIFAGVLTAMGDTKFIMIVNALAVWVIAIVPALIAIIYFDASPVVGWMFAAFYGILNSVFFFLRYRRQRLKETNKVKIT